MCVALDTLYFQKNWAYPPYASGTYRRQVADRNTGGFKIFNILYSLTTGSFALFNTGAILLWCYQCMYFLGYAYYKLCFKVLIIDTIFLINSYH